MAARAGAHTGLSHPHCHPGTEVELRAHPALAAGHIPGDEQHYLTHSGELMTAVRAGGWRRNGLSG
jgi:hypothetical protein